MKEGIHPEDYRPVVFEDSAAGKSFIISSCVKTTKTIKWEDGKEYPHFPLTISCYSHPFYTGNQRLVDTEGRVDRFKKKYAKKS